MKTLIKLIKRNTALFFKDKGMFFCSLITPIILLVLYVTFLADVYKDAFIKGFPEQITVSDKLVNGFVSGQLLSSLLAVCCITVAFCANMTMVQDKYSGVRQDLLISPVRKSTLAVAYYLSTVLSTLIICFVATGICFIYMASGWLLSFTDVLLIIVDVIILVMFGTALSSLINYFLNTQGQMSAVGTIVSAGYGFISGAYMPISSFSTGLQNALGFLPGTYGTSLIRNHAMAGAMREMADMNVPTTVIDNVKKSVDCSITVFETSVPLWAMYLIMVGSIAIILTAYVLLNKFGGKKRVK